jgi:hypothetical protein
VRLPKWQPAFPPGTLERIYLHWTAGDYHTVYPAYHYCIALDDEGESIVCATRDLRSNMREVRDGGPLYAAHVAGRNSFAAGVAVAGMLGATPQAFGEYPLRDDMLEALCRVARALADAFAIPVDAAHVATHAEAAVEDGYFGAGADERWDIARLRPEPSPLEALEAVRAGDRLRARIRA